MYCLAAALMSARIVAAAVGRGLPPPVLVALGDQFGAGDVLVGPNGGAVPGALVHEQRQGSVPEQRMGWLAVRDAAAEHGSLDALSAAAAIHLGIDPAGLVLADRTGVDVDSLEQAVASGVVYGRAKGENWMWPAHAVGDRVQLQLPITELHTNACTEDSDSGGKTCSAAGDFELETLSISPGPRVFRVASFLSAAEVDALAGLAADPTLCQQAGQHPAYCEWQHSGISGRQTGVQPRTSSTQWLGPIFGNWSKKPPFGRELKRRGAPLLRGVIERAKTLLRSHSALIEGMQVIRYAPGQHYHAHADYHTGRPGTEGYDGARGFYGDPSSNRFATLLVYMSDENSTGGGFRGGETVFPLARCPPAESADLLNSVSCERDDWAGAQGATAYHRKRNMPVGYGGEVIGDCTVGLRVVPRKGDAVLFYSMQGRGHGAGPEGEGQIDAASFHAGCDVIQPQNSEGGAKVRE